ncbi:hypothetical protein [Desulfotalea psychrophila]|uniref:hypothetical protein n=1 Tax=Desulfotalea psychrophila TaxID=84980 RepID=UPI0002D65DF2|nr:hypothetical protein [Desulfotalea psychrophila]
MKRPVLEEKDLSQQPVQEEVEASASLEEICSGKESSQLSETDLRAIFADQDQEEDEVEAGDGRPVTDPVASDFFETVHEKRDEETDEEASCRDIGAIRIE